VVVSLTELLGQLVDDDPDAVLAIDAGVGTVSRRALADRAAALAGELAGRGVGTGDCVAVWLPNWSDALVWQFAAAAVGAHVIGVNTRYNSGEVTHVLDRARPTVVAVAHDFVRLDLAGRLRRAVADSAAPVPSVAVCAGPAGTAPADLSGYDVGAGAWVPGGRSTVDVAGSHPGELAVAFTTSGSTGLPKLAAHRQSAVAAHARADAAAVRIGPGDVMACLLPLSGVFGFTTAMAALAGGAACLLEPVFDEHRIVGDLSAHGVTHLVAGDDMLVRLRAAWTGSRADLSAWRWAGVADFVGTVPELAAWALAEFGTVFAGVYGSSELMALTAVRSYDDGLPRRHSPGGRLVSDAIEVRVVEGELQFRGPNVVDAYLGSPGAWAENVTADGWFASGDLGSVAADGSVEFLCRRGDALRLRGFLVDPAEIERHLLAHPAVEIARVVGVPSPDGETRAVAFAVAAGVSPEDLRAWCAETLARFKVPEAVRIVDAMPTTSGTNGTKIRTATLREWARDLIEGAPR
jgi:acyl-CoA synthetase (AMP-forming)/AMP-acid ligase II